MSHEPPRRMQDELPEEHDLRRALAAAARDLPGDDRVEAMLARLDLPPSGGDGGDGGAGPDAPPTAPLAPAPAAPIVKGALGLKIALVLGGVVGGAAIVAALVKGDGAPSTSALSAEASATSTYATTASTSAVQTSSAASAALASAPPSAAVTQAAPRPHPEASALASGSSSAEPARSEATILREARGALAGSPARALALCDEHAAAFPRGALGQEREMIRIQALLGLGRRSEAQARVDAFKKANPGSAYAQRLDALMSP